MRSYDSQKTAKFFNQVYSPLDLEITAEPEKKLHARDHMLIRDILEPRRSAGVRLIDFGCGQGRLLAELHRRGFDVQGMEKHDDMRRFAEAELAALGQTGRILAGGVDEFAKLPDASFDAVTIMGVVQYLSEQDYRTILQTASRLLLPGGCLAVTFQNSFFDMFTFNKYTTDFLVNELLAPHLSSQEKAEVARALGSLMTNADKPPHSEGRARDNIFVRLTNPLLIEGELRSYRLTLKTKYFYDFFGLPPLLQDALGDLSKRISSHFEIERASSWEGHFMANAFLAECEKAA